MDNKELEIVYLGVDELTPYEKNARKHGTFDVAVIKKSIEEFGFNDPIGIWGDKNIIVEGHGRLIAAKELGMDKVPCIRLDNLTEEQRKAYTLTHNRSAELSLWDIDTLDAELKLLEEQYDLQSLGFAEFLNDEIDMEMDDPELNEHNQSKEKEVECPYCGEKFLI